MDKIILKKFFEGAATDDEVGQVRAWVESSPENQRELFHERKLFDITLLLGDAVKTNESQTPLHRPKRRRVFQLHYLQIAAMLAVVFTLGMLVNRHKEPKEMVQTVLWYENVVPLGAKSQVQLVDGTTVILNAGSRFQYSTDYGSKNREVRLEGEAYFEVAKNTTLPFEVTTSDIKVKALGTAFNVKAYPGEATIETILVDGNVEVSRIEKTGEEVHDNVVLLQPEQRLTLKKPTNEMVIEKMSQVKEQGVKKPQKIQETAILPKAVKTVEATTNFMINTSWKDKRWRIESEELGNFAFKLERRYNVIINFEDKELSKYKFNGTFEDEPIEEVLRALALAAPVKFSLKGNQVTLSRNNLFEQTHQSLYEQSF